MFAEEVRAIMLWDSPRWRLSVSSDFCIPGGSRALTAARTCVCFLTIVTHWPCLQGRYSCHKDVIATAAMRTLQLLHGRYSCYENVHSLLQGRSFTARKDVH